MRIPERKRDIMPRPSTEQMTQWLQEDLEALKEKSLEKARLDVSETIAESVILKGPIWWKPRGTNIEEEDIQRGKTDAEEYLYSHWNLMILHIAENSAAVYECLYAWSSDGLYSESTSEYFYEDIVRVSTSTATLKVDRLEIEKDIINPGCSNLGCGNIGCCGCLGAGCLGYVNPLFVGPLFAGQFHQTLKDAFDDSYKFKLPDFLKPKRAVSVEGSTDDKIETEEKSFKIDLSGGQSLTCLIDSPYLQRWGVQQETELADNAVTAITRRVRDKKADKK